MYKLRGYDIDMPLISGEIIAGHAILRLPKCRLSRRRARPPNILRIKPGGGGYGILMRSRDSAQHRRNDRVPPPSASPRSDWRAPKWPPVPSPGCPQLLCPVRQRHPTATHTRGVDEYPLLVRRRALAERRYCHVYRHHQVHRHHQAQPRRHSGYRHPGVIRRCNSARRRSSGRLEPRRSVSRATRPRRHPCPRRCSIPHRYRP
ncbi:hypothetical protein MYSE111917_07115 [Mycobacterium senriense]